MKFVERGWQWICRPDAFVRVYSAIDRDGDVAVLKETVEMLDHVLVVEFQ